ncbi:MAG: hypothetical protein AAFN76_04815 [Pseudomonadota bacterium]
MYNQDSLFDLSLWGRFGVLCISGTLFAFWLYAARRLLSDRPVWMRLFGAFVLFWLFVWLSPQAYYMFYRLIIPDLPLQWVIWPPEGLLETLRLLVFQGPATLSAHGKGLLGWALLVIPFLPALQRTRA